MTAAGKYVGSAGLAQAVNPATIAVSVLSVVSFVVGQYHMSVISNQLDSIFLFVVFYWYFFFLKESERPFANAWRDLKSMKVAKQYWTR